ncbi:MAG: hypothetical protein HY706_22345 [Candidatus Hydrogenedentes bacterium]|nr:hypothetical protein [Candidatus Hydrogenedentota bacterium]
MHSSTHKQDRPVFGTTTNPVLRAHARHILQPTASSLWSTASSLQPRTHRPSGPHGTLRMRAPRVLALLTAGWLITLHAWSQVDSVAVRAAALGKITAGDIREGATELVIALRDWPEGTASIDAAVPTAHLLLFDLEYLMDDAIRRAFVDQVMKPDQEPADDLMLAGLYLNLDSGLSVGEFRTVGQKLQALTNSPKPWVRALALALLASPYYFRDSNIAENARTELVKQFPDLELTRAVLRAPLYISRKKITADSAAVSSAMAADSLLSARRNDPVAATVQQTLDKLATNRVDEGVRILVDAVKNGPDAHTRFGCLYMLEEFAAAGRKTAVKEAASVLANSSLESGDATYARIQLLRMAAGENDKAQLRNWCETLLAQEDLGTAYTRNMYEDLIKEVSKAAEELVRLEDSPAAIAALEGLAAKFPNSVVAAQAQARGGELRKMQKASNETTWETEFFGELSDNSASEQ